MHDNIPKQGVNFFVELSAILAYINVMRKKHIYIDVVSVVDFFGGSGNMCRMFEKYNFNRVTTSNLHKWRERQSIPLHRWLEVEYFAMKEGVYKQLRKIAVVTAQAHPETSVLAQEGLPSNEAALL